MTQRAKILVGIDWGTQEHAVVVIDDAENVLLDKRVEDSGAALAELMAEVDELATARKANVLVGIETAHGHVAVTCLLAGFEVYTLNPKQLDRFRDRFSPAGAKDDRLDALVLATSLRTDAGRYNQFELPEELTAQLREWTRVREDLVAERVAQGSKLRAALLVYFPQLVRGVDDMGALWVLELITKCPTPDHVRKLRKSWLESLLRKRRVRSITAADLLAKLRERPVLVAPGVVKAKSGQVQLLVAQLKLSREQLRKAEEEIDDLLEAIHQDQAANNDEQTGAQSDVEILLSMPGLGKTIAATLLAEASEHLTAADYKRLRLDAGVAPVTRQTGIQRQKPDRKRGEKHPSIRMRRACKSRLRQAINQWANVARMIEPRQKAKYKTLRGRGQSHGHALRNIGDGLLYVLCTMLRNRTLYDPQLQPVRDLIA